MTAAAAAMQNTTKAAVLLHGIGLNRFWMVRIARALKKSGYTVYNRSYPTTRKTIEQLALEDLFFLLEEVFSRHAHVDFVTHSLGSLVLRRYLLRCGGAPAFRRAVMLGPPHGGSEIADALKAFWPFRWFFGPAGQELGTRADNLPQAQPPIPVETGIIAGTLFWMHFVSGPFMPRPNDGMVTVASTHLPGQKDHLTIRTDHSTMVFDSRVIRQVLHFLQNGRFDR